MVSSICCIIPDRGDRPEFTRKCIEYLNRQTLQPNRIELVKYTPESDKPDLTQRIRRTYERLKHDYEVFAIIENDDWYSDVYLQLMYSEWKKAGEPILFGIDKTVYYHILKDQHKVMEHPGRASLFTTWIKGGATIDWPTDDALFLDIHLWKSIQFKATTNALHAIGIKHGVGKCGGVGHTILKYDQNGVPYPLALSKDIEYYYGLAKRLKDA